MWGGCGGGCPLCFTINHHIDAIIFTHMGGVYRILFDLVVGLMITFNLWWILMIQIYLNSNLGDPTVRSGKRGKNWQNWSCGRNSKFWWMRSHLRASNTFALFCTSMLGCRFMYLIDLSNGHQMEHIVYMPIAQIINPFCDLIIFIQNILIPYNLRVFPLVASKTIYTLWAELCEILVLDPVSQNGPTPKTHKYIFPILNFSISIFPIIYI